LLASPTDEILGRAVTFTGFGAYKLHKVEIEPHFFYKLKKCGQTKKIINYA